MAEDEEAEENVNTPLTEQPPASDETESEAYCETDPLDMGSDSDELKKAGRAHGIMYAKLILPHVGLIMLSCLYAIGGAVVFYYIEEPNEKTIRQRGLAAVHYHRDVFLERLWNMSLTGLNHTSEYDTELQNVTKTLFDAFDTHYISAQHLLSNATIGNVWSFTSSLFFTTTLLTTIGYGNLVPVTVEGRIFCIGFGLLGIPLILITVTDLGKFLGENIVDLYCKYLEFVKRYNCTCRRGRRRRQERSTPAKCGSGAGGGDGETFLVPENQDQSQNLLLQELQKLGLEGYVDIPATLVFAILLGYIALGAVMLQWIERWSFFDAFYFSFITMTTVGFGDVVPENEAYFAFDLLYIVVGLSITTMCIDLVGVQYIMKIHYFGRVIQDARYTFINVSGKLLPLSELLKYASALQRRSMSDALRDYSDNQLRSMYFFPGAYTPHDIKIIRYIDLTTSAELLLRDQYSCWERDHEVSRHTLATLAN